ncbi:MAG: hypothetical protein KAS30_04665, partial [Candidatus Diapherotrites archaeon]|nr:hypothetical protein [Candidatus Diapherotrites archaeon]
MPVAYPGMLANDNPNERLSGISEAAIGFGLAIQQGTNPDQVKVGGGAAGVGYRGIAMRVLNQEGALADAALLYNDEDMVAYIRSGYVYLNVTTTGAKGAVLNANDTTGVIKAGAAGGGETLIPGATLEEAVASAPAVALCRLASE